MSIKVNCLDFAEEYSKLTENERNTVIVASLETMNMVLHFSDPNILLNSYNAMNYTNVDKENKAKLYADLINPILDDAMTGNICSTIGTHMSTLATLYGNQAAGSFKALIETIDDESEREKYNHICNFLLENEEKRLREYKEQHAVGIQDSLDTKFLLNYASGQRFMTTFSNPAIARFICSVADPNTKAKYAQVLTNLTTVTEFCKAVVGKLPEHTDSEKNESAFMVIRRACASYNDAMNLAKEPLNITANPTDGVAIKGIEEKLEIIRNEEYTPDTAEDDDFDDYFGEDEEENETQDVVKETPVDIDDTEEDEDDFEDIELIGAVNRVMDVMKDLYEVGFDLKKPTGMLTKHGLLYLNNGKSKLHEQSSLAEVYSIVNNVCGGYLIQSEVVTDKADEKLRDIVMRKGTTYYPEYHLGNAVGITSKGRFNDWRSVESALKKEVNAILKREIERENDINTIVDALTTGLIISEYDPHSCIKLRLAVAGNKIPDSQLRWEYESKARNLFGGRSNIGRLERLPSGVIELVIVTDDVAYNGKPLFAYEAVNALVATNRTPSIKNAILGQDVSGKITTTDLTKQQHCITLIGAGQRSGKGVLTLNLLGTILSSGCPLVYLDSKPDMSVVIRGLADKYGVKAAVWDTVNPFGNTTGRGAPGEINSIAPDIFGKLVYLKVAQLMMAIAHLSMLGNKLFDTTPFFVFDEVLAFQQTVKSDWNNIVTVAKNKKDTSEAAEWCKRVVAWGENIQGTLGGTVNSQLPASGVKTVWLFQSMQSRTWTAENANSINGSFNPFMNVIGSRLSTKWMGRGTFDCENGLMKVKDDKEIKNKIDNRWFAQATSQKIMGREDVKMFKPYLVLNTANNGDDCVEEFRKNVGEDVWKTVAPEGALHPGAGFEGFIDLLGEGAVANLSKGMELLERVMSATGLDKKYSTVEQYLYDASIDSFFDLATLKSGDVFSGANVKKEEIGEDDFGVALTFNEDEDDNNGQNMGGTTTTGGIPLGGMGGPITGGSQPAGGNGQTRYGGTYTEGPQGGIPFTNPAGSTPLGGNAGMGGTTPQQGMGITQDMIDNAAEEIEATGVTPEQFEQILSILNKVQPVSSVDNKGYTHTTETNPEYAQPMKPGTYIDCTETSKVKLSGLEEVLTKTPMGANLYVEKMFKSILDDAATNFRSTSLISRVSFIGGSMYINKMPVNLNGVLGGPENIQLEQLFDIEILFKRYRHIRELDLDTNMLSVALMQAGNGNPYILFEYGRNLQKINITDGRGTETIVRGGNTVGAMATDGKKKADAQAIGDTYRRKSWGDNWEKATKNSPMWGAQAAKKSLKYAGSALGGDKVKPFRGILAGAWGLGVGAVGAVTWFGWSVAKTFRGMKKK